MNQNARLATSLVTPPAAAGDFPVRVKIAGLDPADFASLFALDDLALARQGIRRVIASAEPGINYPCRVSLDFAKEGEELLLLNYRHLDNPTTPYRAEGPLYVRRAATRFKAEGEYPPIIMQRMMSLRGYDNDGMMVEAEVAEKEGLVALAQEWLARPEIAHVDIHSMRRGCFFCRIERA
ncbi:MAG: DUF1203 domain-containing protein [Proteobacteria bacterium]|nr:DUF1203 domain-containing protein [Pseudomonadota bacterium]